MYIWYLSYSNDQYTFFFLICKSERKKKISHHLLTRDQNQWAQREVHRKSEEDWLKIEHDLNRVAMDH